MLFLMFRTWLLAFLAGFVLPGVCGIDIFTPREVEAVNGTNVKLKCTFSSTHPVSSGSVTVSWTFRPINAGGDESVFYYQDQVQFPPSDGRFKGHVVWSGDVMKKDASITLQQVPPTFNGTYICQVRNRPDVHGSNGEIILKVINKVTLSEIGILAAVVGGACGVILVLLGIIMAVKFWKRKQNEQGIEEHPGEFEKGDPTVCSPAQAILTVATEKKEAQSADDEESKIEKNEEEEDALGCSQTTTIRRMQVLAESTKLK